MKRTHMLVLTAALVGAGWLPGSFGRLHAQYTPPSETRLQKLLADPDSISGGMLKGASAEELADLIVELVERVMASDLSLGQKRYLIADISARIVMLSGDVRNQLPDLVLSRLSETARPWAFSGMSIGGRGSESFMAALRQAAGEDPVLLNAVNAPQEPLTVQTYNQIVGSLSRNRTLPPPFVRSLPPPLPVEEGPSGETPPSPPPVGGAYPDLQ